MFLKIKFGCFEVVKRYENVLVGLICNEKFNLLVISSISITRSKKITLDPVVTFNFKPSKLSIQNTKLNPFSKAIKISSINL